jgi:hypothetical protein
MGRTLSAAAANRTASAVTCGSTPLSQCCAVLCVDCRVSEVEAVLCNGIENCACDFYFRRVPNRPQCHASFKPPTYLRINPRWKDVAAGIGRERVKPAFAAAEQVDRLCQRQTSSRHRPVFKLPFEHRHRVLVSPGFNSRPRRSHRTLGRSSRYSRRRSQSRCRNRARRRRTRAGAQNRRQSLC